jgi:hypothetical protein
VLIAENASYYDQLNIRSWLGITVRTMAQQAFKPRLRPDLRVTCAGLPKTEIVSFAKALEILLRVP